MTLIDYKRNCQFFGFSNNERFHTHQKGIFEGTSLPRTRVSYIFRFRVVRLLFITCCCFILLSGCTDERKPRRFPVATAAEKNDNTSPGLPPSAQETKSENSQESPKYKPDWVLACEEPKTLEQEFHERLFKPPSDFAFTFKEDEAGTRFFMHNRVLWVRDKGPTSIFTVHKIERTRPSGISWFRYWFLDNSLFLTLFFMFSTFAFVTLYFTP